MSVALLFKSFWILVTNWPEDFLPWKEFVFFSCSFGASGVEQEDLSDDSLQTFVIIWWEDGEFSLLSSRLISRTSLCHCHPLGGGQFFAVCRRSRLGRNYRAHCGRMSRGLAARACQGALCGTWPWHATSLSPAALEASQCPVVCQTIRRWPCSAVFKSSEDLGWAESDPGWKAEVEAAAFGLRGRRLKGVCLSVGVIVCFIFSQSLNQCLAVHINWQEIKYKFPKWKLFCLQQGSRKPGKTDKRDVCRNRFWHRKW